MRDAINWIRGSGYPTIVSNSLAGSIHSRDTRTAVTRIYSAVTDSKDLYDMFKAYV